MTLGAPLTRCQGPVGALTVRGPLFCFMKDAPAGRFHYWLAEALVWHALRSQVTTLEPPVHRRQHGTHLCKTSGPIIPYSRQDAHRLSPLSSPPPHLPGQKNDKRPMLTLG